MSRHLHLALAPKPLPASPCQGRSGLGSPPDKGELEGVWGKFYLMESF